MAFRSSTLLCAFTLALVTQVGCQAPPSTGDAEQIPAPDGAKETEPAEAGAAEAESEPLTEAERFAPAGAGKHIKVEPAGPLTDEEKALIEAKPADLSVEDRRKRAYALRKKIMQNPDSAQAQSILQGAAAMRRGDVPLPEPIDGPASSDPEPGGMKVYPAPGLEKKDGEPAPEK